MARGIFSGLLMGTVLAGAGLGALSLLYPGRPGDLPATGSGIETEGSEMSAPEVAGAAPDGGDASGEEPPAEMTSQTDNPTGSLAPDAPAAAGTSETQPQSGQPASAPDVGADGTAPPISAGSENAPEISNTGQAPDVTLPGAAPQVPSGEDAPVSSAQPAMPAVQEESGPVSPAPENGQEPNAGNRVVDIVPEAQMPGAAPDASGEALPDAQMPPASAPDDAQPGNAPEPAGEDAASATTPGTPAGQIGNMAENVTTNRLPTIGQGAEVAPTTPNVGLDVPAIQRNSEMFENPEDQPLMAVLLQDIGGDRMLLGDLKNLPFAITFVVDAATADASDAISFYRQAGAEVVLNVPLPQGATPSDVEVTLSAYAPLFKDVVAMMAPKDVGFQALGVSATQVAVVLAASGHGLISVPQGLNTGHKSALKEGVAAGLVFRELDNDGQDARVIGRFMDNAAFKARQNDGVIMLGHARVETIQALIEWSLGNRAKSVALAPVSVVLSGG